ncbi:MAG: gliding motility-associated ABC transporter substrate-binding protein GldG [Marinifilaceae bacterium]|jgi:ABC-2 type transport system permease protein|nr:gliding motility-associated ABC transporter substrate-binding protein GldG [Marinifilaceae bacterium]
MKIKIKNKKNSLFLVLIIIITANLLGSILFFRIDLTEDGRYSLTETSKNLLHNLDEKIYVELYLSGNMPVAFKKLQNACIEMLDEFSEISQRNIEYSIVDISQISNPEKRNKELKKIVKRGLTPLNLQDRRKDGSLEQLLLIPGLIVHNMKIETSVNLVKNNSSANPEKSINDAIANLEYNILASIKNIITKDRKKIGVITGHDELNDYEIADFVKSLSQKYDVMRMNLSQLTEYNPDAIIIAKPRIKFQEEDKYYFDQFLMKDKSVLWMMDEVFANIDSLQHNQKTYAIYNPLNIEDLLFNYGVRVNPNLVLDKQCQLIPVQTGMSNNRPMYTPASWLYNPLLSPGSDHIITRNINPVKIEFANSIDLTNLENKEINRTVLLQTSAYTSLVDVPVAIDLSMVNKKLPISFFNAGRRDIAVLLEGKFNSAYRNSFSKFIDPNKFLKTSKYSKLLVISDGDIAKNKSYGVGQSAKILPLGYDRYSKQTYGNKEFLINALDFMLANEEMIQLRSKRFKLRLLDKKQIQKNSLFIQLINLILPILLLAIFGIVVFIIRKSKFSK